MNWLVCCFVVLQAILIIKSAPAEVPAEENSEKPDCKQNAVTDVYDERQNGSDINVRIHMKGVALIVAPPELADTAIQSLALESLGENQNLNNQESVSLQPPSSSNNSSQVPFEGGLKEKTRAKLSNVLQFLKHFKGNKNYN